MVCSITNCTNKHHAKTYCVKHYARYKKWGDAEYPVKEHRSRHEVPKHCEVRGCNKPYMAKGMCEMHYSRKRKYGDHNKVLKVVGQNRTKHPLYKLYHGMKDRCYNPNNTFYRYYGGRGIGMDKRWLGNNGFTNFCKDIGERPEGYTIDRIDNNKGYSPDNCMWKSRSDNQLNRGLQSNNTSGEKGIHKYKANGKWTAYIDINGKRKHLGYFNSEQDAIEARRRMEDNHLCTLGNKEN